MKSFMSVWMYYTTDGDSGCYDIVLFQSEKDANEYKSKLDNAYGRVSEKKLFDYVPTLKEVRGY